MPDGARISRDGRIAAAIIAIAALAHVGIALVLNVLEAETYYWLWSRELAWGYFDHPPLVAIAMQASPLFGDSALGLRVGHIALSALGSFAFYGWCVRWLEPRAALISLAVLQLMPFWLPFGFLATPDGPLLAFWCVAIYAFARAEAGDGPVWWLAAGVAAGLTILSKYNGALLLPVFFAALLLSAPGRRLLRGPWPWIALALAVAIVLPNQLWNQAHAGDATLRPFKDGLEFGDAPKHVGIFVALPFVLLTPLVGWAWLRQSWFGAADGRLPEEPGFRLAVCASWVPLFAFATVAVVTEIHAHWIVPCLVTALPVALENFGRRGEGVTPRFLRLALVSGGVFVFGVVGIVLLGLVLSTHEGDQRPKGLPRLAVEVRGWEELGARLDEEIANAESDIFVTAAGHPLTSRLAWHFRGRLTAHPLDPERSNQFGIWDRGPALEGRDALYVDKPYGGSDIEFLKASCREVELLEPVRISMGGVPFRRFEIAWCRGYHGLRMDP